MMRPANSRQSICSVALIKTEPDLLIYLAGSFGDYGPNEMRKWYAQFCYKMFTFYQM